MFRIPAIQSLRILESCYRLNSFTRAADELGISQGAVSQQIKSLEQRLGFAVFLREGRSIVATPSGEALVHAVRDGLGHIAEVVEVEKRKQRQNQLVISVLPGFAIRWLFPRLMSFEQAWPALELTVNAIGNPLDFSLHHAHAAITYEPISNLPEADWLFTEQLFPVCSADFAQQYRLSLNDDGALQQLPELPRLLDGSPTEPHYRDGWAYWADQLGLELTLDQGRRYSQSNMTLQLAELSHGIALGRSSLVMDAINTGKLIRLGQQQVSNPCGYRLVTNPAISASPALIAFQHWLSEQTRCIDEFEQHLLS